ncbi:MAG: hypothetical protein R3B49_04765 [Phycisphaerales bacterium]
MRRALALGALVVVALVSGCKVEPKMGDTGGRGAGGEPPAYEEIARAWNERVDGLDRLWARAVVRVEGNDAAGKRLSEQAEGHLQIVQPDDLALSLGKVGETRLHLGSDGERYWWLDSIDPDHAVALVGRHDKVTLEKAAALGLPVHPLDLIELLGITPLPAKGRSVGWSKDGTEAVFNVPARWGSRWVWVDPVTFEPRKIALADEDFKVLAEADLEKYDIVRIDGDATRQPEVATRVIVRTPAFDGWVRMTLYEPRNRSISAKAFELGSLLKRYGIEEQIDVDDPAFWAGARAGAGDVTP